MMDAANIDLTAWPPYDISAKSLLLARWPSQLFTKVDGGKRSRGYFSPVDGHLQQATARAGPGRPRISCGVHGGMSCRTAARASAT
jgi:hypothetical protein